MIQPSALPENALLKRYALSGASTDCYHIDVPNNISFAQYVMSFYTSPLFKVERIILALIVRRPSSDKDVEDLANERIAKFAAWDVEDRNYNQILLRDFLGRTRSWLMVSPLEEHGSTGTRLYFGSAFIPKSVSSNGTKSFGFAFHVLADFHRLYTKALMRSARLNLNNVPSKF